ncbi:neuronal acetylcholine receptor subunit alpha-6-like [Crassostrea angulata]|uniref:neuronal acetylcholine receptor subunit alpha-6-like n=1 Tax=Magallana angulata TaxID=2784310 RepID=UPI0022B1BCFD|nr:neuronal acetylcholine receptor subunit alpha-6-like [Crassostrea angulata]
MMRIAAIFVFCCRTAVIHAIHGTSTEEYIRLQESLLENYSNEIRPVRDQDKTVFIHTSYYLTSINEVDVVGQRLITTGFLFLYWRDEFLQWDKERTGISMMYFKQKHIWTPDVVLKNDVKTFEELGGDFYYLEVTWDGYVRWLPFQVFESKCDIDITYFPFDEQICNITFHSWSFTKWEVNVTLFHDDDLPVEMYDYVENSVWDIVFTGALASPDSKAESEVTFILHLRRKPLHYVMNLILPVVLLGVLNLLVFVIPADAGEKMSFAMTVFLSFAVFLSIISMQLPVNSEKTSLVGSYLVFQMTLGVGTIVISSFQLRLHYRKADRKVGRFYRGIVKVERFLRCKQRCGRSRKVSDLEGETEESDEDTEYVVNWNAVSSAIDFVSFWTMLVFEVLAITIFVTLINSAHG